MMLGLMAFATVLGATPATGVFAADPASFNNSTASTVSGTNSETFTAGSDASQKQVGKETDQVLGGCNSLSSYRDKVTERFCICYKVKQRTDQGATGAYRRCNKERLPCRCKG